MFRKFLENLHEFFFRTKEKQRKLDREISKRIELEFHLYKMRNK